MAQRDYVDLLGQSGRSYRYWVGRMGESITASAGNYGFAKQPPTGSFAILYLGETEDFSDRFDRHERWLEAVMLGATHVLAHTTPGGEQARCAEEGELIQRWQPPMNVQHRTFG
jgi:hypothetical protein